MFNAQVSQANSALQSLGTITAVVVSNISSFGSSISTSMSGSTAAIRDAGTQMMTSMQESINQMRTVVDNGMTSIVSSIQSNGALMVSSWRSVGQQMITITQSFVNSANSYLRNIGSGVNLYSNGSALMAGLNQGIQAGWRNVMDNISTMAESIQDVIADDSSSIGWQIGLGISDGLDSSMNGVTSHLDAIRDHVNDFSLKSKNLLTGATATMSSQLKVETLRGKTPIDETSSRQEAYIAHSTSLLSDVIDSLSELREQVAQGQTMVLDTGALIGGTAYAYDEAVGNIQALKGRHRL